MSDERRPWFGPGHYREGIPRQRRAGEEVWRLRHADGRVMSCELRDDSQAGAGWDVMILEDGAPLFSRRCVGEDSARFAAQAVKQDNLRGGWAEEERNER